MSGQPLVSIICLCFNHVRFVEEAIESVLQQTYKNIELIVVDDCSTDGSQQVIRDKLRGYEKARFIPLPANVGNCKAFNLGWKESHGVFVIDLAADDVLLPSRVAKGVKGLTRKGASFGVNFSNAEIIDEQGNHLNYHYPVGQGGASTQAVPDGDVFPEILKRYFICPPTMIYRREVLDLLEGYDETLSYEDFDFWVRSSRVFNYSYHDEVLVKKRTVKGSKSHKQFKIGSRDNRSTYRVCKKAAALVRSRQERKILKKRLWYELRQSFRLLDFKTAAMYLRLSGRL